MTDRLEFNPFAPPESDLTTNDVVPDLPYALISYRMPAFLIDGFLFAGPMMVVGALHQPTPEAPPPIQDVIGIVFGVVASICGYVLYNAIYESSGGKRTFGKRLLGLIVVDLEGNPISFRRALIRNLLKVISYVTNIGFLMQPFTRRKQALHDILTGTVVLQGKTRFGLERRQGARNRKSRTAVKSRFG